MKRLMAACVAFGLLVVCALAGAQTVSAPAQKPAVVDTITVHDPSIEVISETAFPKYPVFDIMLVRSEKERRAVVDLYGRQHVSVVGAFESPFGSHTILSDCHMLIRPTAEGTRQLGRRVQNGVMFQVDDPETSARVEAEALTKKRIRHRRIWQYGPGRKLMAVYLESTAFGRGTTLFLYSTPLPSGPPPAGK